MRKADISRKTNETDIELSVNLDGGEVSAETGIGFFDHMLKSMACHAGFGLTVKCRGDLHVDGHHTVEDVGIALGRAFGEALGDKVGITRFASCYAPLDEALCRAVADISGRPFLVCELDFPQAVIGDFDAGLTVEFFRAFAMNANITLHIEELYGSNSHHIAEAAFKAAGICLENAVRLRGSAIPSTKGCL